MKFQTYREGGEREEERRGKGKEKGRKEREKGRRGRRRERGLVRVTEVVGTCMYTRRNNSSYLYFLEVSCFERVPRFTHIHILFRKTLHSSSEVHKYTVVKRYIY